MLTRRQFLELASTAVGLGLAAACDDTLRGSFGQVAVTNLPTGPRKLTTRAALSTSPTAIDFATANGGTGVFAYNDGDQVVILSNLCTHRGCSVAWDPARGQFNCPCHGGTFDKQGKVLLGPPIAPLTRYTAQDVGGDLYISG